MADVFERLAASDGLSCKLYRGEGLALLAFDLDAAKATDDFVGFSVEVKYPQATRCGALKSGFASSQAYADRFHNESGILPPPDAPSAASLEQNMAPIQANYDWLGFEARRLILGVLEQVQNDPSLTLDALIYESKEPDILARLQAIGSRLRVIIDDHDEQGDADSAETISFNRLVAAGASGKRLHFSRQQHNKVLIMRRGGEAIRVLCGSTNFRVSAPSANAPSALKLARPPAPGKKPWFASYYRTGHVKERDRLLFIS